jgi:hypothetical protein
MELVSSMMHSCDTAPKFWTEATYTAIYVLHKTLSRTLLYTPFESWYQCNPSLSHLRIFGCPAYIYAEKHRRTKLDSKSHPRIFIGYTEESKAYCWDTTKDKIVIICNVIFHENSVPTSSPLIPIPISSSPVTIHFPRVPAILPVPLVNPSFVIKSSPPS